MKSSPGTRSPVGSIEEGFMRRAAVLRSGGRPGGRGFRPKRALLAVALAGWRLPEALEDGIGWRTDGSGLYPRAVPPLEWSPTRNVVWKTPMPGYGVSHPVPLGERLFTCSEPATLLCLSRTDGKILWQK